MKNENYSWRNQLKNKFNYMKSTGINPDKARSKERDIVKFVYQANGGDNKLNNDYFNGR